MKKRHLILTAGAVALTIIAISAAINPSPRLIWNASASVPIGYYAVAPTDDLGANDLAVGDLLVVTPPPDISDYLATRGYVPKGVPLLKYAAALPRQMVCRHGQSIIVDGRVIGRARLRDRHYWLLPVWQGCRKLNDSQIFLMNMNAPDSLDGRYFGPLSRRTIIGKAAPIWVDHDGNGELTWRDCCKF